jgi:acyl dehydratase
MVTNRAQRDYQIGQKLPSLVLAPLTRHTLALYCGGSGDHNPLHTDSDFARQMGLPDVIGHGMLTMAYLGRMITDAMPVPAIRSFDVRFKSMALVGDVITCTGIVTQISEKDGIALLNVAVLACVGTRELASGEVVISAQKTGVAGD